MMGLVGRGVEIPWANAPRRCFTQQDVNLAFAATEVAMGKCRDQVLPQAVVAWLLQVP